jgi:hypothetical protein
MKQGFFFKPVRSMMQLKILERLQDLKGFKAASPNL